jgi:hypothetical protein
MIFPLFAIGTSAFNLAGYHARASRDGVLQPAERPQLRGLAVPQEPDGLLASFADGRSSCLPNMSGRLWKPPRCSRTAAASRRRRGPRSGQPLFVHAGLAVVVEHYHSKDALRIYLQTLTTRWTAKPSAV